MGPSCRLSVIIVSMEFVFSVHVEPLPEGYYLATSGDLPGLVAQGRTITEALEIARDVAKKLIEARQERDGSQKLPAASDFHDYKIVVGA